MDNETHKMDQPFPSNFDIFSTSDESWKSTSNRSKKKSRQGCKTCKTRKVKCDEKRPACGNCETYYGSKVIQCDYDQPASVLGRKRQSTSKTSEQHKLGTGRTGHVTQQYPNMNMTLPRRQPLLIGMVGSTAMDPFNKNSRITLPHADQLLHNYVKGIVNKCLPAGHSPENNPLVRGLWSLLQADVFYHNVILQVSAVELEYRQGTPGAFKSELYTRESLRLLRSRIEDGKGSTSDETIAAVATLATLEYGKKNMVAMKMHVDGLKRMIGMRGGLSNIRRSSQTTATLAHWFTMLLMQGSIFPPDDRDTLSSDEATRMFNVEPPPRYLDLESFAMEDTVRMIIEQTRRVSEHFASGVCGEINSPDDFHWRFNSLLQKLGHLKIEAVPESNTALTTEACRQATSLFLFLPFHNHYPDPTLIINSMLHRLKSALTMLVADLSSQSQLLLWLLSVGGVVSRGMPEREWFAGHLVPLVARLEINSWPAYIDGLEGIVYVRQYLDAAFRELWEDITTAAEILAVQDPYNSILLTSRPRSPRSSRSPSTMPASESGTEFTSNV